MHQQHKFSGRQRVKRSDMGAMHHALAEVLSLHSWQMALMLHTSKVEKTTWTESMTSGFSSSGSAFCCLMLSEGILWNLLWHLWDAGRIGWSSLDHSCSVISLTSHPFKFNLLSFDFLYVYEKGNFLNLPIWQTKWLVKKELKKKSHLSKWDFYIDTDI